MTNDIDTLATALYVRPDDLLKQYPDLAPWRPKTGLQPQLSDTELVTLADRAADEGRRRICCRSCRPVSSLHLHAAFGFQEIKRFASERSVADVDVLSQLEHPAATP